MMGGGLDFTIFWESGAIAAGAAAAGAAAMAIWVMHLDASPVSTFNPLPTLLNSIAGGLFNSIDDERKALCGDFFKEFVRFSGNSECVLSDSVGGDGIEKDLINLAVVDGELLMELMRRE